MESKYIIEIGDRVNVIFNRCTLYDLTVLSITQSCDSHIILKGYDDKIYYIKDYCYIERRKKEIESQEVEGT